MTIAIFGGSFDPFHIGHEQIITSALKSLDIHKLIIVPTYISPFKSNFYLKPTLRYNLLKKFYDGEDKVEICDYEIKNHTASYSINTIKYLKKKYNASKIYFIIGADNLNNLHNWYKYDEIQSLVEFVVACRDGYDFCLNDYKTLKVDVGISSTELRKNLNLDFIPKQLQKDFENLIK